MLEYKNVSIRLESGTLSAPLSLIMRPGMSACLQGDSGKGKSSLLRATLGLHPLSDGFITFDGELVTPGAASYFRNMMAYIPQDLPQNELTVREIIYYIIKLRANAAKSIDIKAIIEAAQKAGVGQDVWDKRSDNIDPALLQQILLVTTTFLQRKIVLIDNIVASPVAEQVIGVLKAGGAEIIYTCRENHIACDQVINL